MSIIAKLRKNSETKYSFKELAVPTGEGETTPLRFRIRAVSLGELMRHLDGYPRVFVLIEGMAKGEKSEEEQEEDLLKNLEKVGQYIEAFESLICIAVELEEVTEDGQEPMYHPFVLDAQADGEISPSMLGQEAVTDLGQAVVTNFRYTVR